MPVITVDKEKVAVPRDTKLIYVVSQFCHPLDTIHYNGKKITPKDLYSTVQDGDKVVTYITIQLLNYPDDPAWEVDVDSTLEDVMDDILPLTGGKYRIIINGSEDITDSTVLKDGDKIEFQKLITVKLQGNVTYVPEGSTILCLYTTYHWTTHTGTLTVNGKPAALNQLLSNGDDIRCQ